MSPRSPSCFFSNKFCNHSNGIALGTFEVIGFSISKTTCLLHVLPSNMCAMQTRNAQFENESCPDHYDGEKELIFCCLLFSCVLAKRLISWHINQRRHKTSEFLFCCSMFCVGISWPIPFCRLWVSERFSVSDLSCDIRWFASTENALTVAIFKFRLLTCLNKKRGCMHDIRVENHHVLLSKNLQTTLPSDCS